jgi:hypothetical protein
MRYPSLFVSVSGMSILDVHVYWTLLNAVLERLEVLVRILEALALILGLETEVSFSVSLYYLKIVHDHAIPYPSSSLLSESRIQNTECRPLVEATLQKRLLGLRVRMSEA